MSGERYPLHQVIFYDLISHNKVAILLLIGVVISGLATIWVTNQTRALITEQAKLVRANQKLDYQYIHLQMEENAKSEKSRVEAVAERFGLQAVKKEQEVILVEQ